MILFISEICCYDSFHSFLFLLSRSRLSILFILTKNQSFLSFIFWTLFIYALIFVFPSFNWLCLIFYFINMEDFYLWYSWFLMITLTVIHIPISTAFAASHSSGSSCLHFHTSSGIFLFLFWFISPIIIQYYFSQSPHLQVFPAIFLWLMPG